MQSLTKENFWNGLQEAFPEHMKQFCNWVDQYKARREWQHMFNPEVKFHHLPLEMQAGIVFLFFQEVWGISNDLYELASVGQTIKDVFAEKFMTDTMAGVENDETP